MCGSCVPSPSQPSNDDPIKMLIPVRLCHFFGPLYVPLYFTSNAGGIFWRLFSLARRLFHQLRSTLINCVLGPSPSDLDFSVWEIFLSFFNLRRFLDHLLALAFSISGMAPSSVFAVRTAIVLLWVFLLALPGVPPCPAGRFSMCIGIPRRPFPSFDLRFGASFEV